ncbi:hypothetical protein C0992_012098 [Termitomyces sp. T32_za158]|nr:hypothetical protein C0992_012098 [Termitomyces sp. T32_za158]
MSQASLAVVMRALQRARGPPLLAWYQANGSCHYCAHQNADCVFEEPQEGSWHDSMPNKGKCKAVLETKVPKHVHWWLSPPPPTFKGGPLGSNVFLPGSGHLLPSITICQGVLEILRAEVRQLREEVEGLREEVRVARQERNKVARAWDTFVRDCNTLFEQWKAQDWEIKQLWARLVQEAVVRPAGTLAFTAPLVQDVKELARGLHQSDESEVRRREWLLRKVVEARMEVLGWACKHCLLIDGMSLGVSYVEEELLGHEVTPGVTRGVGHLSRLMEAHWHRIFVKVGSWLEAFMDGLRMPPTVKEMMQAAQDLLEAEFGPRGGQGESQEGRGGGD